MTQELIINGQAVDIADADITLEYVSGLFEDIGSISLSRSYTIKLPRTQHNAQVLGFTGGPAQEPEIARGYFSANYYRNGVGLLGPAQAYLLAVTPEAYEVALLWNSLPELIALKESKKKLRDMSYLPDPAWPGTPATESESTYSAPTFYASYVSGLKGTEEQTGTSAHPCVTLYSIVAKILSDAGIPYDIEQTLGQELQETVLLVAPSHRPSLAQEVAAGAAAASISRQSGKWWFSDWQLGWDSPYDGSDTIRLFQKGTQDSARVLLNLKVSGASPDLYLTMAHGGNELKLYPQRTDDGGYLLDESVELKDLGVTEETDYYSIEIQGLGTSSYTFSKYDNTKPLFAVAREHEALIIGRHTTFPIVENLPDIGQLDFLKAVMALFGAVAFVKDEQLVFVQHSRFISMNGARDWTGKVDMTGGGVEKVAYTKEGLARRNVIRYTEDAQLSFDPNLYLEVLDDTLPAEADAAKLPFAASEGGAAIHYEVKTEHTDEGFVYEVSDIDIKPRVFGIAHTDEGARYLTFPTRLYGSGGVAEHYQEYQEIIRRPVVLEVLVRLNELDLVGLDFITPVYLGQYGRYYYILKVQTSDTDLCKVELIQLP